VESKAEEHPGELRDLDLQSQPRFKERKGMEEILFRAAHQWQTIFDSIADFVCLLDSEGKILRCNKSMKNFLGKAFNEIINRPCSEVMRGAESRIAECPALRKGKALPLFCMKGY
jgi:PAS domain-containing protein